MTNEEAIIRLKKYRNIDGTIPEELSMAISALEYVAQNVDRKRVIYSCQLISWHNKNLSVPSCDTIIKGA